MGFVSLSRPLARGSIRLLLTLTFVTASAAVARSSNGATAPATSLDRAPAVTAPVASQAADTQQLADEITRRLRRLGISFNPARLPHPYDPAGEIC